MLGDFFFPGDKAFDPKEIPSEAEVKTFKELEVELPADNADFHTLAAGLAGPAAADRLAHRQGRRPAVASPAARAAGGPGAGEGLPRRRRDRRGKPNPLAQTRFLRLQIGPWTVPGLELTRPGPQPVAAWC